ncbi:uncharacterized protein TNCT_570241, partial [Trichonephila clavata]
DYQWFEWKPMPSNGSSQSYMCTNEEIYSWSLDIKQCLLPQQNTLNDMEWSLRCLLLCIKKTRQKQCYLSKFSQFELAVQYILNIFKDCCDVSVKSTNCATQCDCSHLKECIVKFFLYYVSLHNVHTNNWHETIETHLGKVKICMQTALNTCSFKTVQSFIKVFGAILMIEIPDVKPGFVTTVTYNDSTVWCSTAPKNEWITLPDESFHEFTPVPRTEIIPILVHIEDEKEYPLPLTEEYSYVIDENRIFFETFTPSTVQYIEIPIQDFTVRQTYPKAETSFQSFTIRPRIYKDKFEKLPPKIEQYTIPPKFVHAYQTQTTRKLKIIKPKLRLYEKWLYYTAKQYKWTKSNRLYEEHRRNTEKEIAPVPTKVYEFWKELPPTQVEHFTPRCSTIWHSDWYLVPWNCSISLAIKQILTMCGGCEEFDSIECRRSDQNTTVTDDIICDGQKGFKCKDSCNSDVNEKCCCNEYEIRILCCEYRERLTKPPPVNVYFPAKGNLDHKTMRPLPTEVIHYPQKPHKYFDHYERIPTEVICVTVPKYVFTKKKPRTTVKIEVHHPKEDVYFDKVLAPPTEIYKYPARVKYVDQHVDRTTTKSYRITKKPKKYVERIPKQSTRIIKYPAQSKFFRFQYTPTTSRTQNVPLTKRFNKQILTIPTQIEHFTESAKRYHQHVTPTKVKYVTIPVQVQTFTDVKNQTEVRYVWKEVKVKEVLFVEVPVPVTEKFHYGHKVHNYWDHLEATTAEIEVIQPEIESELVMFPMPPVLIVKQTPKPCENRYSDWFQVIWNCSMVMSVEDIITQCGECEALDHIECRIRNPTVTDYEYITCNNHEGFRCMDVCSETYTDSCCCNEYEIRGHCGCEYAQHIEKPTPKYNEYIAEVQHQRYTYPPFVPKKKVYEVQDKIYVDSLHPKKILVQWTAKENWFTQKWRPTTKRLKVKLPPIRYWEDNLQVHTESHYFPPQKPE